MFKCAILDIKPAYNHKIFIPCSVTLNKKLSGASALEPELPEGWGSGRPWFPLNQLWN